MAQENLDQIVKSLIKESMFSAFFFSIGIQLLKQATEQWDDETVVKQFGGLWTADALRKQIKLMDDRFPK